MTSTVGGGYAVSSKSGILSKYKNFLLGWRNRFIKIDRSYVHDFEAQDAPNPSDSLVRGEIVRCSCNLSFKGAAGPYVFDVVTRSGHTWYLRARTWEEQADWMLAIWPDSKHELDRLKQGTSNSILNPESRLPPPLMPQPSANPDFGVFPGDPPVKNPNACPEEGESSSNVYSSNPGVGNNRNTDSQGGSGSFPPSYADLFDRHDPNVQKK